MSVLSNDSDEMAGIPHEKPVRPTVIVENVMIGLMQHILRNPDY